MTTSATARETADAARTFLDVLDEEQRAKALEPFDDEAERRTWFYWPSPRAGLPLREMTAEQGTAAMRLLSSALSLPAYAKATQIIALERVLDDVEGRVYPRDPALYYVTVFGRPGDDAWAWRFEGHHVSVHVTVVGDDVASVPAFLGANPATVRHGDRVVSRPLGEEEDVARELLRSLDDDQRAAAVVSPDAPDDILTSNAPEVGDLPPQGLDGRAMGHEQRDLLTELVTIYLDRARDVGAALDRVEWDRLVFAWAGSPEPGERHYYRVVGPTLVIEYDNTQNDANHAHAVWRDRSRDFGADLLRAHLASGHR